MCIDKKIERCITEKVILYAIRRFIKSHHYSPTFREIMEECDLHSTHTIYRYLRRMKVKGLIDYSPKIPRSIRIISQEKNA